MHAPEVLFPERDGDVARWHGPTARAGARGALVLAQHVVRDGPVVADLARHEIHLADRAAAAAAPDPVGIPVAIQALKDGLALKKVDRDVIGLDCQTWHRTSLDGPVVPAIPTRESSVVAR